MLLNFFVTSLESEVDVVYTGTFVTEIVEIFESIEGNAGEIFLAETFVGKIEDVTLWHSEWVETESGKFTI